MNWGLFDPTGSTESDLDWAILGRRWWARGEKHKLRDRMARMLFNSPATPRRLDELFKHLSGMFLRLAFDGANLIGNSMLDTDPPARAHLSNPGRFATTHWSVVLAAAQTQSSEAEEALEALCRQYWYPLYAWLRRKGHSPHEAEDMTQEFFCRRIVTKLIFKGIHPGEGRFRTWLLGSLQNLLLNEYDRLHAQKRGGGRPHVPLECQDAENRYSKELAHELTPDKLYERAWAVTLLEHALTELQTQYEHSGRTELFFELKSFLPGALSRRPHVEAASRLGKSEEAVKMAVSRLRQDYGRVLKEEIKRTVSTAEEAQTELRNLLAILGE